MAYRSQLPLQGTFNRSAATAVWTPSLHNARVGIVAHRGLHHFAPENSRGSFQDVVAAVQAGVPVSVEFDIRATKDAVLVVNHDCHFRGVVLADITYAELQLRFGTDTPVLLEEVVHILSAAEVPLINAELKEGGNTSAALRILATVPLDRLLITSFHAQLISEVKQLAPRVRTGLLLGIQEGTRRRDRYFVKRLKNSMADTLVPHQSQLSARLCEQLHLLGKDLGTYTVNEPQVLLRMNSGLEVDWIATDMPEVIYPELLALHSPLMVT